MSDEVQSDAAASQKPEKEKTYRDLVREYFPGISDDECDFILWERTAFPVCDTGILRKQLGKLLSEKHAPVEKGPVNA